MQRQGGSLGGKTLWPARPFPEPEGHWLLEQPLLRGTRRGRGPALRSGKDSLSSPGLRVGVGSVASVGQSQSQELGGAEAEGEGSLAFVAPVVLAGGGEPPMPAGSGQRLRREALNTRLSPSSNCGLSPRQGSGRGGGGGSAFRPRDAGRWPQPTPCVHSPAAGGGGRPAPGSQSSSGGASSGRRDPGSGSPAPAAPPPPAPARAPLATQTARGLTAAPQPRAAPGA